MILKKRLRELADDWQQDQSFVENVIDQISGLDAPDGIVGARQASSKGLTMIKISFASLVAAVVLIAMLFCLPYFSNPDTAAAMSISAQVRNAIEQQDSIHVESKSRDFSKESVTENGVTKVITSPPDSWKVHITDIWFVRGVGYTQRASTGRQIQVDNGKYNWALDKDVTDVVYRTQSLNYDQMVQLEFDFADEDYERMEQADITVDGEKLACYANPKVAPFAEGPQRYYIYLDSKKRIHSTKTWVQLDKVWHWVEEQTVSYNIQVDRSKFEPDFDSSIEIIDLDQQLDGLIGLENCHYQSKASGGFYSGSIYATHRIQLIENGGIAMLVSIRRSEKALESSKGMMDASIYRDFAWNDSAPRHDGFFSIKMAGLNHNDVSAMWYLLVPRPFDRSATDGRRAWVEDSNGKITIEDSLIFRDRSSIQFSDGSRPEPIKYSLSAAEKKPISVEAAAHQVYRDLESMKGVASTLDFGVEIVDGTPTVAQCGNIENTSIEKYTKVMIGQVDYWRESDLDAERKAIAKSIKWGTAQVRVPAIFAPSLKKFNDEHLEQAAKRKNVIVVNVSGTSVSDTGLICLQSLEELEYVYLSQMDISDVGLKHLEKISTLKRLDVRKTKVTKNGIEAIKAAMPELEVESDFD